MSEDGGGLTMIYSLRFFFHQTLGSLRGAAFAAAAVTLGAAGSMVFAAPPTTTQMLQFRPRQTEVQVTTPKPEEESSCRVDLVKGTGKASGWVLRDSSGIMLRRFFDTNGDNKTDTWSFFRDGVEVYREIDTNNNGKPDQYRWLNSGGLKWGVDADEDLKIDSWLAISPEEVSHELLRAIITKDAARFSSLLLNESDLKTLELPEVQARTIREKANQAAAKFQSTLAKATAVTEKSTWLHLELGTPQCIPADQLGSRSDLVRHPRGSMLLEIGGKTEWIQTGELLQIGAAWKMAEGPAVGLATEDDNPMRPGGNRIDLEKDPALKKLLDELAALDQASPGAQATPEELAKHHISRADILEKIGSAVKASDREPWYKQLADSLASAAQSLLTADSAALKRLKNLEAQLVQFMPGSNLTAYVAFRLFQTEYAQKINKPGEDFTKLQQDWVTQLTRFVQTYPKSDDAPEALMQLGLVCEFLGKDQDAKSWYGQVVKWYGEKMLSGSPLSVKATGALRRLDSEGQTLVLQGPFLANPSQTFDIETLKGKVVLVYFGATWNQRNIGDLAKLKLLTETHAGMGLELVTISMDANPATPLEFLKKGQIPGIHLFSPMNANGQEGKLATDLGIVVVPHLFLVGKDGKVINRNAQVNNIEDELKRVLK